MDPSRRLRQMLFGYGNSYYLDNLYSLLLAIEDLAGSSVNSGDWFAEIMYTLEDLECDPHNANVPPSEMKAMIVDDVCKSQSALDWLAREGSRGGD